MRCERPLRKSLSRAATLGEGLDFTRENGINKLISLYIFRDVNLTFKCVNGPCARAGGFRGGLSEGRRPVNHRAKAAAGAAPRAGAPRDSLTRRRFRRDAERSREV